MLCIEMDAAFGVRNGFVFCQFVEMRADKRVQMNDVKFL